MEETQHVREYKGQKLYSAPPTQTPENENPTEKPVESSLNTTPPVEEKPVETPAAETPQVETTEAPAQTPETPVIPEGYLSPEDFSAKQSEWEKQVNEWKAKAEASPFASDFVKQLNDMQSKGHDIQSSEFWKWQNIDLNNFDASSKNGALELVKLQETKDNPELNSRQIDRLMKKKYPALYNEDLDNTDQEYLDAVEDLTIDATRARTKLEEYRNSVLIPSQDLGKIEAERQEQERQIAEYRQNVTSIANSYEGTKLMLGDAEVNFAPTSEGKQWASNSMMTSVLEGTFFQQNYVKEGNIDTGRILRDLTRLHDYDKHIKASYDQGVSAGKKEVATTINGEIKPKGNDPLPDGGKAGMTAKEIGLKAFYKNRQ